VQHRTELLPELECIVKQRRSEEWAAEFDRHQIPWGPINTIDQVLAMPQVRHRKMRVAMRHPLSDRLEIVGSPLKLSDTPPVYEYPPPLLGEHTEQVLRDLLHYSADRIQALRQEHAI
jgi:crotonobetainyl-CoA:carnitine CoA-transferase CaiB-like acyl-CoA transferase